MSDCAGSKSSSGESNRSSSSSTITLKQNAEAGARAIMVVAKKKKNEAETKLHKSRLDEEEQIRRSETARKAIYLETNPHLLMMQKENIIADRRLSVIRNIVETNSDKVSVTETLD